MFPLALRLFKPELHIFRYGGNQRLEFAADRNDFHGPSSLFLPDGMTMRPAVK